MASAATFSAPASSSPSLLESLPARPPTPPREASHEPESSQPKSLLNRNSFDPQQSLQTPPNAGTPQLSTGQDSNQNSTRPSKKKVGWSNHTDYQEPSQGRSFDRFVTSSPASLPSGAASNKPIRGILKRPSSPRGSCQSNDHQLDGSNGQVNLANMLDSSLKQLAGSDRSSKLDAYMMLSRGLKASNNLPDRVALQDKMSLLTQFIQRDLSSKFPNGTPDSTLINHALNLLATFLHFPAIASTLNYEFNVFVMDGAIRSFGDAGLSKSMIRSWMQVVAFQDFSPKVITAERVARLLASLHAIEDVVRGKSIVMGRIKIYRRLVRQSKTHMATHNAWLEDMLIDMTSDVKDIRDQAIGLGLDAGFILRNEKTILRKMSDLWQQSDENQTYGEFYLNKLEDLIADRGKAACVPQILSVLALFMRCPLDRWKHYSRWLKTFQKAFNSADANTKQEANYAWNRYVYLSLIDSKVSPKSFSTLCQPLLSQLRRKTSPKHPEEGLKLRKTVVLGICSLYYYAFAPGNSSYSPDMIWDVAVDPVTQELLSLHGKPGIPGDCLMTAARLLIGLLDISTPRIWRQDRITTLPPVKVDELPSIDAKWVRKNCDKVFKSVGPILESRVLELATPDSWAARLWGTLVKSVATASAKDVKVSEDTAKFIACTLDCLAKMWSAGPTKYESAPESFFSALVLMIRVLVDNLGLLPFTERKLTMSEGNIFEPIATPSHKPTRAIPGNGLVATPLQHLYAMFKKPPQGSSDDSVYWNFFKSVMEPFFAEKTAKARLDMARALEKQTSHTGPTTASWKSIADQIQGLYDDRVTGTVQGTLSQPQRSSLEEMVSHLMTAYQSQPDMPCSAWKPYLSSLAAMLTDNFGDAGCAIILIGPLSHWLEEDYIKEEFRSMPTSTKPPVVTTSHADAMLALFDIAKLPLEKKAMDAALRRLYGSKPPYNAPKTVVSVLDFLVHGGNSVSKKVYSQRGADNASERITAFLSSMAGFLSRSQEVFLQLASKENVQETLIPWIKAEAVVDNSSPEAQAILSLWTQICTELEHQHQKINEKTLKDIEPLLIAGFTSSIPSVVGKAVDLWNLLTSNNEDELVCSASLQSAISSARSAAEAHLLQGTTPSSDAAFGAQRTGLLNSHSGFGLAPTASAAQHEAGPSAAIRSNAESDSVESTSSKKQYEKAKATPEKRQRKSSGKTSTPRLRHDNSQIQFAPVESSPPNAGESQHLTEHQKEVRERQRQDAAIYSDVASASPRLPNPAPGTFERVSTPRSKGRLQKATPERAATYEELISSTPTPKRGQTLHLEDFTDPPSSPPEPRPCPLRDAIVSRSRSSSSLQDWDFSSPTNTPVTSRQQVLHDVELPKLALTNDSTDQQAAGAERHPAEHGSQEKEQTAGQSRETVIPSSVQEPVEESNQPRMVSPLPNSPALRDPLPRRARQASAKSQASGRSAEDDFVDARSSPEAVPAAPAAKQPSSTPAAQDVSISFGEGNDSEMVQLLDQLENANNAAPFRSAPTPSSPVPSVETKRNGASSVAVQQGNCSAPDEPCDPTASVESPAIPSATSDAAKPDDSPKPTGKNKRKRDGKTKEDRRKKRRSGVASADVSQAVTADTQTGAMPSPRPEKVGVQTRRSSRRLRRDKRSSPEPAKPSTREPAIDITTRDEGDTDEEVFSQLVEEAKAASEAHSRSQREQQAESQQEQAETSTVQTPTPHQAAPPAPPPPRRETRRSRKRKAEEAALDESTREADSSKAENQATAETAAAPVVTPSSPKGAPPSIMETLQSGLDGLRGAALTREDVYKMEDLLMDMKRELYEAERRGRMQ